MNETLNLSSVIDPPQLAAELREWFAQYFRENPHYLQMESVHKIVWLDHHPDDLACNKVEGVCNHFKSPPTSTYIEEGLLDYYYTQMILKRVHFLAGYPRLIYHVFCGQCAECGRLYCIGPFTYKQSPH